jgi:uncharacterized membrane protein YeiH
MDLHIPTAVDLLGIGFLAASGAIAAAERRQDIVTFIFFGAMTGIGGGTLRDLLIGQPVFWVHNPAYLIMCIAAAVAIWVFSPRLIPVPALLWADAIGLCAYAVVGAQKAAALHLDGAICVAMGVLTACFGGILRDVLAGQPSVLLRREIYVTAAILAASAYVVLERLGVDHGVAIFAAMAVGLLVRGGSLVFGWTLPAFGSRAPAP